jgi:hypothetical protein
MGLYITIWILECKLRECEMDEPDEDRIKWHVLALMIVDLLFMLPKCYPQLISWCLKQLWKAITT